MAGQQVRTVEVPFCGVGASFANEHPWRRALATVRDRGIEFEAYAPFSDEETLRELTEKSTTSVVRLWTLLGGIFGGVVVAFAMVIWMSRDWPLVVGGKPIVSFPPFICICFEMTVLYAAFACTGACFVKGKFPHLTLPAAYRPEFMHDRFGAFVACQRGEAGELRSLLEREGADKTWLVYNPERGRLAMPVGE